MQRPEKDGSRDLYPGRTGIKDSSPVWEGVAVLCKSADGRSLLMVLQGQPHDPPLPYAEQALSCLAAYRDDAHLSAWRPSGLSAPALEARRFVGDGVR